MARVRPRFAKTKVLQKARDSVEVRLSQYRHAGPQTYTVQKEAPPSAASQLPKMPKCKDSMYYPPSGSARYPAPFEALSFSQSVASPTGRDTRGGDAADGGAAVGCPRGRAPAASAPVAFGTGLAPTALIVGVGRAAASWGLCACVFWGRGANAPTGVCAGAAKPDPRAGAWGMGKPDGASPGSNAGVAEAAAPAATTGARGRSPTAVGRRVAEGRISAASSRPPCCFFSRCMIEWP